jgi:hypothetical protein
MLEVLKIATLPITVFLAYALFRLLQRGPTLVPHLARSGFSLKTWLTGTGLRDEANSTIRSANGLVMRVQRDKNSGERKVIVEETINLSSRAL